MLKIEILGAAMLSLVALTWTTGAAQPQSGDAQVLAHELRDAGLPLQEIELGPEEAGRQEVTATGPGLSVLIASFGSQDLYREWEGMLRHGPGGHSAGGTRYGADGPEEVGVFLKEPFVVVATWPQGDEERAAQVRGVLGGFEEIGR